MERAQHIVGADTTRMPRLHTILSVLSTCMLVGCAAGDRASNLATQTAPRCKQSLLQENKRLAREYYETVVSQGALQRLPQYVSPRYAEIHQGVRHELGYEGAREHILGVRRTYPDLQLVVERQIAEGEWVVSVVTGRGTHRGVWLGMKPTNKPVQITAVNVDRIVDGRILEHRGAANLLLPLMEIGAVKVADPIEPVDTPAPQPDSHGESP